jgi:hypothetical protein
LYGAPQDVNVEELTTYIVEEEDEEETVKAKKKSVDKDVTLLFKLFWSTVLDDTPSGVPQCAPLIYHQRSIITIFLSRKLFYSFLILITRK